ARATESAPGPAACDATRQTESGKRSDETAALRWGPFAWCSLFHAYSMIRPNARRTSPSLVSGREFLTFADDREDFSQIGHHVPVVFVLHEHFSGQNFLSDDLPLSLPSDDERPHSRQFTAVLFVGVVFIAQAALQTAATTRNLRRVKRGFLQL